MLNTLQLFCGVFFLLYIYLIIIKNNKMTKIETIDGDVYTVKESTIEIYDMLGSKAGTVAITIRGRDHKWEEYSTYLMKSAIKMFY